MRWKDGFILVPGTFKDTESENVSSSVVSDSVTPWTSLPGSSVHGILQARILELVAILFSRRSSPTQGSNQLLLCLWLWSAGSLPLAPPVDMIE